MDNCDVLNTSIYCDSLLYMFFSVIYISLIHISLNSKTLYIFSLFLFPDVNCMTYSKNISDVLFKNYDVGFRPLCNGVSQLNLTLGIAIRQVIALVYMLYFHLFLFFSLSVLHFWDFDIKVIRKDKDSQQNNCDVCQCYVCFDNISVLSCGGEFYTFWFTYY